MEIFIFCSQLTILPALEIFEVTKRVKVSQCHSEITLTAPFFPEVLAKYENRVLKHLVSWRLGVSKDILMNCLYHKWIYLCQSCLDLRNRDKICIFFFTMVITNSFYIYPEKHIFRTIVLNQIVSRGYLQTCFDLILTSEKEQLFILGHLLQFFFQSMSSTQCTKLFLQVSFPHLNRYRILTQNDKLMNASCLCALPIANNETSNQDN